MTKANDNSTTSLSRRDAVNLMVGGAAGASGLVGSVACAEIAPDPMFAAIEAHRSAAATMNACPSDISDEEFDRLGDICREGWDRILDTTPTTTAGLLAFIQYVGTDGDEHLSEEEYEYEGAHEGAHEALQKVEQMIELGSLRVTRAT